MVTLKNLQSNLQQAIQENNFEQFLDHIREALRHNAPIVAECNLLMSRLNEVRQKEMEGTISFQDASLTTNQIRRAFNQIIFQIREIDLITSSEPIQAPGTSVSSTNLSASEISGLQSQLDLLIQKLNLIRKHRAIETDPSRIFALDHQINDLEQEITTIKQKLGIE